MQIGVIGSGSWATALSKILTDNNNKIYWWFRNKDSIAYFQTKHHNPHYLNSAVFDMQRVVLSNDVANVINNVDAVLFVTPSAFVQQIIEHLPKNIFQTKIIISAIKGILPEKNIFLHSYLQEHFDFAIEKYFTIMGPCHAEEIAAEKLSYLTFSGKNEALVSQIATHFKTDYLTPIVNSDVEGSQFASVMKNIYAVGAGIAHGLDYGDNFLSVYISNCARELISFLNAISNDTTRNYSDSVYLGDLLVTCYSLYSRNRTFGSMIGKGYSVKAAQLEMNMIAEGYSASKSFYHINQNIKANLPIMENIYKILWENLSPHTGFGNIEKVLK